MNDVETVVGDGRILLAEACNGFGKTISALSALLPMGRQITYATRTHDQVRQVLQEVEHINSHSEAEYSAVNLASRDHLCLNADCRGLPSREAQELCGVLRKEDTCPFRSEILDPPRGLPLVLSAESLVTVGRRLHICPYFLARRAAKVRRLVVAPYPYVFDPKIRLSTGLELEGHILVLDEGHNIDHVGQDTFSDTLSERSIASASDEVKAVGFNRTPLRMLADHLSEINTDEPRLVKAEEMVTDITGALGSNLNSFIEHYVPAVEAIRAMKQKRGDPPISFLNGVLNFVELVQASRKERYIAIYQRGSFGSNTLEYRCLDPSIAMKPLVKEAEGILIMSGTLSPLRLFADVLGLKDAELRSYPAIQSSDNIKMTIDARVTTILRERNQETLINIGRIIAEALPGIPNGALIFFPQRDFMEKCITEWAQTGIIDVKAGRPRMGGKPLFREGRDARGNQDVVTRFKASAVSSEGGTLCCVFRGRNSEGSNFPDNQCRGIFLVGVPYASYGDPLVRAQIAFYDRQEMGLGHRWYTMDAFRAANQALGRGIRSRTDWCHYWLLDLRYTQHMDLVSHWAKGKGPKVISPEPS